MALSLGDLGAAVGSIGATYLQDRFNTRARHDAQNFESEMFSKRYQTQVADLKAAGLNPMLAYMTGPGGAPGSSAQSIQAPDVVGSVMSSRSTSAQVANVNADTVKKAADARNIDTDTFLKMGMIDQVAAMTASATATAEQSRQMAEQIRQSIPKIEVEIRRMEAEIAKDKSNVKLNDSLIKANSYLNSLRKAETVLHGQESILKSPKVEAIQSKGKADKSFIGETGIAGDVMQNFWKMINPFYNVFGGK